MERKPEPAPLATTSGSGRKPPPPGTNRGHAPWDEPRTTELHTERGKAPPRARRHHMTPEAGRLMANDHLESEQLDHQRQIMRTKHAHKDRHARTKEKRRTNRSSMLREQAGALRRVTAQHQEQSMIQANSDLAPRKGRAVPVQAKARWAEPRQPGGARKVLT